MMKRKTKLERAIILSLILSTGVCSSAWADGINNKINETANGTEEITKTENVYRIEGTSSNSTSSVPGYDFGIKFASDYDKVWFTEKIGTLTLNFKNLEIDIKHSIDPANYKDPDTFGFSGTNYYLAGIMTESFYKPKYDGNGLVLNIDADSIWVETESQNNFATVGVWAQYKDTIKLTADTDVRIRAAKTAGQNRSFYEDDGFPEDRKLEAVYGIKAGQDPRYSAVDGVSYPYDGGTVEIISTNGLISVTASTNSRELQNSNIYAARSDNGVIKLTAKGNGDEAGTIELIAVDFTGNTDGTFEGNNNNVHGLDAWTAKEIKLEASKKIDIQAAAKNGNAYSVRLDGNPDNGLTSKNNQFIAPVNNLIAYSQSGEAYGLHIIGGSIININNINNEEVGDNYISSFVNGVEGTGVSIYAAEKSQVFVDANKKNDIYGTVYSDTSTVEIDGLFNNFLSKHVLMEKDEENVDSGNIINAIYATGETGTVDITATNGGTNIIQTSAETNDTEHTVWAQDGGQINISGQTEITATNAGVNTQSEAGLGNAYGIAIAAGETAETDGADQSVVKMAYTDSSRITGDVVAGYNGDIDVTAKGSGSSLTYTGNALAANGGDASVELGEGGVWIGRADDYSDNTEKHKGLFTPAYSKAITKGGSVGLTMGDGSAWYVKGQSWISSVNTSAAVDTLIDIVSHNTEKANTLTIGTMDGDTTFNMHLDGDRDKSDMLYIKEAKSGSYLVTLTEAVTEKDFYSDGAGNQFTGLRFATVGSGAGTFKAVTYDNGLYDVEYLVDTDDYTTSTENTHYDGQDASAEKPGQDSVKKLMSAGATDYKLVGIKSTELSDAGETMLNMSRANYSNAIYMDRLNKRMGEARYINDEEDQGMWVRIRHDRIGKKDAFRSQNTMYELGYDEKQECYNGKRRVGFAVDYMHGDTGYSDIAGKGEIDRYGLWLYDTWMGNKGHYADYVAKWGHLDNEFEIYTPTKGEKVTGDYTNNVFSISAEYGRKKDMGNDWYFEPQVQAQLARVTGADYVTSQGTKVSVEGINSLIGRAGFRLGKDFGTEKQSTFYVKADVLHEFLGDQDIRALDATTNGNWSKISYENEGTWYDVGIGFAAMMSKTSYAFLDLERSFGHDNDETWQINAGLRWEW